MLSSRSRFGMVVVGGLLASSAAITGAQAQTAACTGLTNATIQTVLAITPTTGSTFVDSGIVRSFSMTTGGCVVVAYNTAVSPGLGDHVNARAVLDGVAGTPAEQTLAASINDSGADTQPVLLAASAIFWFANVPAGSHQIKIQIRDGGTASGQVSKQTATITHKP